MHFAFGRGRRKIARLRTYPKSQSGQSTSLRPDGSYDAILLTPWTIEDLPEN